MKKRLCLLCTNNNRIVKVSYIKVAGLSEAMQSGVGENAQNPKGLA